MDQYRGEPCEESVKMTMIDYCLNEMRKRTIDEQLVDLSAIMKSPLALEIVYEKTGLQVTYGVGSLNASVHGLDESTCVHQCKRDVLLKLLVYCTYTKFDEKTASVLQFRRYRTPSSSATLDVYSEIELCKVRASGRHANKDLDRVVLIDPETRLSDFTLDNSSPLVLKISYFPTEWEMVYKTGPYSFSAKGSLKSTNMHQCKKQLAQELRAFVNDAKFFARETVVDREAPSDTPQAVAQRRVTNEDQQRDPRNNTSSPAVVGSTVTGTPEGRNRSAVTTELPKTRHTDQPSRSSNTPKAREKYVEITTKLLRDIEWHAFRKNAQRLFDILVHAHHANRSYLKRITDCLVSNAIDNPDDCDKYADLCSNVIGKACKDSRVPIHTELAYEFKVDLVQSCMDVLVKAGIVPRVETALRPQNGGQTEGIDEKDRDHARGTCRFMGELFLLDRMFKPVVRIVHTFIQSHSTHSLECLCVLLTTIGPKIEKLADVSRRVYETLERYSIAGYAGNTPLPRQTIHMIEHVLNMRKSFTETCSGIRGVPASQNIPGGNGHRLRLQSEDHSANRTPGHGILRRRQRSPPSNTTISTQRLPKRVSFNPVVAVLCYPRHQKKK